MTFKGSASGGTSPYTYAYYYKSNSASSWTTVKAYSTSTSVSATISAAGSYQACIKVKDSTGTEVKEYINFTVRSKTSTLKNNSKVSATTINLGSTVTVTAAASGGTTPYSYQILYKKSTQSKWTVASDYSTTTTAKVKPASAGTYNICVKVKDKTKTEVKKEFNVVVKEVGLTNTSTISSTSITLGNTVTVNGSATGGTGAYNYAVYYRKTSDSKWTTQQDFSSTSKVTVKPASATEYEICSKVRDSNGTIEKKYFTVKVTAALKNNSTVSATSIKLGSSVTVKGAATGGTGYYNFAVYYKKSSDSKWTMAQDYKSNTTVTIKPAKAANYEICIKVKDSAGTEAKVYKNVKVVDDTLQNNSTISATSITLGSSITAKGAATGGTSPYKYAYYYKQTSQDKWTLVKDYSTTTSVTITPAKATTYEVCIKVKDSKGTEAKKYFKITVADNKLTNTSKISATSIKLGSSITATGSATGGTAPYQYAFYYKQTSQSQYTEKQKFQSNAKVSIKPAKATTYDICIKVRDSEGTVEKKYFKVNVTA